MTRLALRRSAAVLTLTLVPRLAAGDMPPPPRDAQCTVEIQERSGDECLVVGGSSLEEERAWTARGFAKRCRIYASWDVGGSVWCRAPPAVSSSGAPAGTAALPPSPPAGAGGGPHPRAVPRGDPIAVARASNAFAEQYAACLDRSDASCAVAPLAIWAALATASAGARGSTASELKQVLHWTGTPEEALRGARALVERLHERGIPFTPSSALFVDRSYALRPEFVEVARASGAVLEADDLVEFPGDTIRRVDAWISGVTGGRLKQLVPPASLFKSTRLVVASAAGLSARLEGFEPGAPAPFHLRLVRDRWGRPVRTSGDRCVVVEDKTVPTMSLAGTFGIAMLDRALAVDLPLGGGIAMTLIAPYWPVIGHSGLTVDRPELPLASLPERLQQRRLRVTIPALRLDPQPLPVSYPAPPPCAAAASPRPRPGLGSLGTKKVQPSRAAVAIALDPKRADFRGMATAPSASERLVIGEMFHRVFLEVADGEGARDAAGPTSEPEITIDVPFLFVVRDAQTSTILVAGMMNDPAPQASVSSAEIPLDSLGIGSGARVASGHLRTAHVDEELVRYVIQKHARQVRACFALNAQAQGTVAMEWIVGARGAASSVKVDAAGTTIRDGALHRCVEALVRRWQFPVPRGRNAGAVTHSWTVERIDGRPGVTTACGRPPAARQ